VIVHPDRDALFPAEDNVVAGNVVLYGATSGEAYLRGVVGERFCVRNSGATAVAEGIGDHGCEYMTGGRVVVLGPTGRNFAAGMSGGIAYVYDPDDRFPALVNYQMVELEPLNAEDREWLRATVERHRELTGSDVADLLLSQWESEVQSFRKVMPQDYKRVLNVMEEAAASNLNEDETLKRVMAAAHG
jgi:glutamate synthase (NADPH/NADH) large chain